MTCTLSRPRGRPRAFDLDTAVAIGQRLFHARGYEGVGLSLLTDALGIKPPSFYAAFGSKMEFFGRVLDRYATSVLALDDVLRPARAPVEALTELLCSAALAYCADPETRGCLVMEAARGSDADESARRARQVAERRREQVRTFVAATHAACADAVTDYVSSAMSGLSASAREGMGRDRLVAVATAAATALWSLLD